ncbi:hypothetical protein DC522_05865 [Microvirga sp. KLBC 81]|uniref:hypothetical protein n=1 Tax=Microvirga sp. KLBC 81 TaxID=1862707 RepID=UPI000D50ABFF|nr:hypothetical protein [Microvirga sp. KLBC 81]PVE25420.1 hypothetical protein DC522_05865 [Microvirga sp. KLBC 81]
MNVRAKFKCQQIVRTHGNPEGSAEVRLTAATSGEANKEWSKWTPSGSITMLITNPSAIEAFELGKEYYVDFTPAE